METRLVFRDVRLSTQKDNFLDLPSASQQGTRISRGVRQNRTPAAVHASADPPEAPDSWEGGEGWDYLDVEVDAAAPAVGGAGQGAGAAVGMLFPHRGVAISNPLAVAQAAERQLRWDAGRPGMQRDYMENLAGIRALRQEQEQQLKAVFAKVLASQPPSCSCCSSNDMRPGLPVEVTYVSVDHCFLLRVPQYHCNQSSCSGSFAPTSFTIGCFPATPKASWDVVQSHSGQPARWFDLRLLQLADNLIFQGSGQAVYSLAAVVHRQHVQNGSTLLIGWEHFKRQLQEAVMLQPPNQKLFLDHPQVPELLKTGNLSAQAEADRACSDFDAAKVLGRTSDKCDVTAVGATTCRHYIVAQLFDISTGERYIYACIMLYMLMVVHCIPILVVWYDINCKYGRFFLRWAQRFPALMRLLENCCTKFPLPIWHKYSHSASCQAVNDGLYMTGVGRQYVEATESVWAALGPHGRTTQYMTQRNRHGRLERAGQLLNRQKADATPALLKSMAAKWHDEREKAAREQGAALESLLQHHNIGSSEAARLLAEREAAIAGGPAPGQDISLEAEYGLVRLRLEYLFNPAQDGLPAAICLLAGGDAAKHAPGTAMRRRWETRLQTLQGQLYGDHAPGLQEPPFAPAAAACAESEIRRLQAAIISNAQQAQLIDALIPGLTGRSAEQEKARKSKQQQHRKVQADLGPLMAWLRGGYVGFDALPAGLGQLGAGRVGEEWTAESICRGLYPWEQGGTVPIAGSPSVAQLVSQLRMHSNLLARCEEELHLINDEISLCSLYFKSRVQQIEAACMYAQERKAAIEQGLVPQPCRSGLGRQPSGTPAEAAREHAYCNGLLLLLEGELCKARNLLAEAEAMHLGAPDSSAGDVEYVCDDEEVAVM